MQLNQRTDAIQPTSENLTKPRLHNRMKLLRQDAELSREQLAEDLCITVATLGNLERGSYEPGLLLAWRIADYFAIELEAIFSSQPMPPLAQALASPAQQQRNGEPTCSTITGGIAADGTAPNH